MNALLRGLRRTRFFKSNRGASGPEYAFVVALVALVVVGAVAAVGGKMADIFDVAEEEISKTQQPSLTVGVSTSEVDDGEAAEFTWSAEGADQVSAEYSLSGGCADEGSIGSGPHGLGWSGASGSASVGWNAGIAGCNYAVAITASNSSGEATETASVAMAPGDATPENLSFPEKLDVEPGSIAVSADVGVSGINVPATIAVSNGLIALAGTENYASSQAAAPGSSVKLSATAPGGFEQDLFVGYTAGAMSGTWHVKTRAQDVTPNAFTIPEATGQTISSMAVSLPVTVIGFDGSLAMSATNGATISVASGPFIAAPTIVENQSFRVQLATSASFGAQTSTMVSVGSASAEFKATTGNDPTQGFNNTNCEFGSGTRTIIGTGMTDLQCHDAAKALGAAIWNRATTTLNGSNATSGLCVARMTGPFSASTPTSTYCNKASWHNNWVVY